MVRTTIKERPFDLTPDGATSLPIPSVDVAPLLAEIETDRMKRC
jgi:hypothetical protein